MEYKHLPPFLRRLLLLYMAHKWDRVARKAVATYELYKAEYAHNRAEEYLNQLNNGEVKHHEE